MKLHWSLPTFTQINYSLNLLVDKILMTPFRGMVVPPPMCAYELCLPAAVAEVTFGPSSASNNLLVLLSDARLVIYDFDQSKFMFYLFSNYKLYSSGLYLFLCLCFGQKDPTKQCIEIDLFCVVLSQYMQIIAFTLVPYGLGSKPEFHFLKFRGMCLSSILEFQIPESEFRECLLWQELGTDQISFM